ncbi:MAG: PorV/PorQ family protein [Elusimicrobiota bacterium]|nr:PorV/PorQ family protein [Elusimicrobiota bacterium]
MRLLLPIVVLLAGAARGAETASYLDIGVGARALGMGGAYTALADDSHAVYWNPAGLARLEKREVAASHAELGNSTRHDFLTYAHPTSRAVLAGALTYLNQGAISGRDAAGRPTGGYDASDAAVAIAASRKTDLVDLGVSVKYLRSHIAGTEAQGFALDAGLRRELPAGAGKVVLGAALRNVGPGLKYENQRNDLPLRTALGGAYRFAAGHALAVELQNGPRGAGTEGGAGGEYKAFEGVFLRLGYTSKSAAVAGSGFDAARGLTLGLGLRKDGFGLDYAAQAAGELGSTHRFTLSARF